MTPATNATSSQSGESASPPVPADLGPFVESLNQALLRAGASQAEQAFGIGCAALATPIGLILLLAYFAGAHNWIVLCLVGLIEILLALGILALLAGRARNAAMQRTFDQEVLPQIKTYLAENQLTRTAFIQAVISPAVFNPNVPQPLPQNAPLLLQLQKSQAGLGEMLTPE